MTSLRTLACNLALVHTPMIESRGVILRIERGLLMKVYFWWGKSKCVVIPGSKNVHVPSSFVQEKRPSLWLAAVESRMKVCGFKPSVSEMMT